MVAYMPCDNLSVGDLVWVQVNILDSCTGLDKDYLPAEILSVKKEKVELVLCGGDSCFWILQDNVFFKRK